MNKKIITIICIITGFSAFFIYPHLPPQIPVHWGVSGQIDQYGDKRMIFVFSFLPLIIYTCMQLLPKIDPKKASYHLHSKAYQTVSFAMALFMAGIYIATSLAATGHNLSIDIFVKAGIGILLVVSGNVLSQIRPNYFFGIRTPWTLANENVWKKTHRIGSYAFVFCGTIIFGSAFIKGVPGFVLFISSILFTTVFIFVYSYVIFKKETE